MKHYKASLQFDMMEENRMVAANPGGLEVRSLKPYGSSYYLYTVSVYLNSLREMIKNINIRLAV